LAGPCGTNLGPITEITEITGNGFFSFLSVFICVHRWLFYLSSVALCGISVSSVFRFF